MMISPHNYLASSPVVQSNQAIKIKNTWDTDAQTSFFMPGKPNVTTMGGESLTCAIDMVGQLFPFLGSSLTASLIGEATS